MGPPTTKRSDLRGVVFAAALVIVLILLGAAGFMLHSAAGLDRVEAERETALVERRLQRMQEQLVEDVSSASIWNDAVAAVSAGDLDWIQVNFGDYYADYMDHELTLVFGSDGRLMDASRASERVDLVSVKAFAQAASPLIAEVAREAGTPARRAALGFEAVASRSGIVHADGQVYLVAVATVVPEDPTVARPARDALVVSARPIPHFIDSLRRDLLIDEPLYDWKARTGTDRIVLFGADGSPAGSVVWSPQRPGRKIILQTLPALAILLVLLGLATFALFVHVDRIARRLSASEAALVEARDRAEAASQAKTRFLANMSHELRTPLNGVMGMAEILSIGELSPIQRSHLAVLKASGQDLLTMIEHILAVTRLDKPDTSVTPTVFNPGDVLRDMVEAHRPRAEAAGLDLTLSVSAEDYRLGSPEQLGRVVGYLLDNALTYTPRGSIVVRAWAAEDRLCVSVSDTGIGIPADVQSRMFEPFAQGDESLTRAHDGAGLGLSICRRLVRAMGGDIRVDSAPLHGSTFTLDLALPLAPVASIRAEAA